MKKMVGIITIGFVLLLISVNVGVVYFKKKKSSPRSLDSQHEVFLWDGENPLPPQYITGEEAQKEVDQLICMLEKGYIGYHFLPDSVRKAVKDLKEIQYGKKVEVIRWYQKLHKILEAIPDKHAKIFLAGHKRIEGAPYCNHNLNQTKAAWLVKVKTISKKRVLLIGILRFPPFSSSEWKGFLEQVALGLKSAEVVVLDLRGNRGGDDRMGRALARWCRHLNVLYLLRNENKKT